MNRNTATAVNWSNPQGRVHSASTIFTDCGQDLEKMGTVFSTEAPVNCRQCLENEGDVDEPCCLGWGKGWHEYGCN